jgi:hypothetical protein
MHCDYKSRDQARASLFDCMEVFDNRQRHGCRGRRPDVVAATRYLTRGKARSAVVE